ncbi:phage tail tape measure protein [Cupriavidus plantarum]|uniref:phage tail tape measure protein n=1 Tax=Cupriavidus plantarum TaxID=942865 RepID=UPI000EB3ABAF|nr:phage tail tape measure protein [Cupriavidus plantarum]RLK45945.1 lambda family phage tail tape measure protein [Cupriavidus plantarum]
MADQADGGVVAGKAVLQVGADATGVKAGMQEGVKAVKQLQDAVGNASKSTTEDFRKVGGESEDLGQKLDAKTKRFLAGAQRESEQLGKTRSEWLAYRAAQLGVSDQAAPFIARIQESEQALKKTGVSAAQIAAALRSVPAQFTDIVTQLAGGQSALLVLTQQGGQLKDMFGGIVPAARALGGYITGLITPTALAAGAFATLALAAHSGSQEQGAFQRSLTLTGNYVGQSANQLVALSAEVGKAVGTQGAAAAVLDTVAASGKVAAEQLQVVGTATVTLAKVGVTVKETVGHFTDLGDEPVKASLKLNEQYHYLTDAVYQQIKALEEQGDKDQAAALAQRTYAEAMTQRANQVLQNLGFLERGWNAVTGAAKGAWDSMLGLGRPDTLADVRRNIAAVQADLEKMGPPTGFDSTAGGAATGNGDRRRTGALARLKALQQQEAALQADADKAAAEGRQRRDEDERIAARQRLDAQEKATRSRAQQRADEIDQLKKDAEKVGLSADEYAKRAAAIEAKYKDRTPRQKAYTEDFGTRYLDQLRQAGAAVQAQLVDTDKLTAAEKKRAEFEQEIADIKTKKVLTADQKSLLARQDEIRAQLALNVAGDAALESKKAQTKEAEKQARLAEQARVQAAGIDVRIREGEQARGDQYSRQLDAFGQGSRALEQVNAAKSIYREFSRVRTDWIKSMTDKGQLGTPLFQDELEKINAGERTALEQLGRYYDQLSQKRADWSNGARAAFADYQDYAANVADQTGRLFGNAFQGMEDALVSFATTGKASFGDLAKSIIADLARIQARAAISGIFQMIGNAAISYFGGGGDGLASGAGAFRGASGALAGASGSMSTPLAGDFFGTGGLVSSGAGSSLFGNVLATRASGGPVVAGQPYLVGEEGREIFVPSSPGTIVPNGKVGGDVTVNIYGAPSQPEVRESEDAAGNKQLEIFFKQVDSRIDARMDKNMRGQGGYAAQIRNGAI